MRDLRAYARQTQMRLLLGFIALLYLVGGGLIYLFYGPAAMLTAWLCLTAGLAPLALIALFLWGLGRLVDLHDRNR